ncbi:hypothetical protein IQN18_15175 (plasmid) [Enterococcus faecium]|nr:hypothetical protein IQN18_15175 [Enterococcus faecium]
MRLSLILNGPEFPQAILLGEAGAGNAALASELGLITATRWKESTKYTNYQSDNCVLARNDVLQTRLETLIPRLKEYERIAHLRTRK